MTMKVEMSDPISMANQFVFSSFQRLFYFVSYVANIYGDASAYLRPFNNMQRTWAWKGFYTMDSTFIGEIKQESTAAESQYDESMKTVL